MRTSTRIGVGAIAAAGSLLLTAPTATPATTAAPYCGIEWGSLTKSAGVGYSNGEVADVRSGQHECFDRLVIDVDSPDEDLIYHVQYVTDLYQLGSGKEIPVRGGATLQVLVNSAAHDEDGQPTYVPEDPDEVVDVSDYQTFRQVPWAGSFEGTTKVGIGTRGRLPFRVMVLDGPGDRQRLVVDVAHRW